jgi:hypothetical protein
MSEDLSGCKRITNNRIRAVGGVLVRDSSDA